MDYVHKPMKHEIVSSKELPIATVLVVIICVKALPSFLHEARMKTHALLFDYCIDQSSVNFIPRRLHPVQLHFIADSSSSSSSAPESYLHNDGDSEA